MVTNIHKTFLLFKSLKKIPTFLIDYLKSIQIMHVVLVKIPNSLALLNE